MAIPSKRSIVNVNFFDGIFSYMFINHLVSGGGAAPIGNTFDAVSPNWHNLLDTVTGYPNTTTVNGHNWSAGSPQIPASADFHGPWVLAWQGDGEIIANFGGTWTEVNAATASSTITSGNVDIPTATQNYVAFQKITFGTTRGNIIAGTTYVVCSSGLTTTNIRIASSQANALANTFITPSGTGASTITPKGQASYSKVSNARWTSNQTSSSSDAYIVFMGGSADYPLPQLGGNTHVQVLVTGGGSFGFVHNVRWYRLEDEDDFLAGNICRKPWKQEMVSHNPAAIRFMNWIGGNPDRTMRWENRITPAQCNYNGGWVGPLYGDSATVVANQMTLAAVTGTPASMQHGEIAVFRIGSAMVRAENGFGTANSCSVNPTGGGAGIARGTTTYNHGFNVNDWIVHINILQGGGNDGNTNTFTTNMPNLVRFPVQITGVPTASTYDFVYTGGGTTGTGRVGAYISLNVGTGSDRAPSAGWPVMKPDGTFESFYGFSSVQLPLNGMVAMSFDKNIIPTFDGSGNPRFGGWIALDNDSGAWVGTSGVSPEIITAIINELNVMSVAQGITNPIHMWINCPVAGLLSIDPDYSSGSNWPVNFVNTVINGSTVNSVTYAGLTANADIYLEFSNETWNSGKPNFPNGYLFNNYADGRFYAQGAYPMATTSPGNWQDGNALRCVCMSRDIKAAFGGTRIKTIMGMWDAVCDQFAPGGFGAMYEMYYGTATLNYVGWFYAHDSAVTGGSWGTAGSNMDAVAIATYSDPGNCGTYIQTITGTGNLTDDGAKYLGTDNTGVLSFTGGTGAAVASTMTSGNASIVGTNTFIADQRVTFDSNVGTKITAGEIYGISATGLTGAHFQVYLRSQSFAGTPLVMDANGSSNCLTLSTTMTTTAVANGPLVVGQLLATANTTNKQIYYGTVITNITGTTPNFTLTLSAEAGVNNGTSLIKSPANSGGDYRGAADPATARQSLSNAIVNTHNGIGSGDWFQQVRTLAGSGAKGIFESLSLGILPGKYLLQYEGGMEIFSAVGDRRGGVINGNTYADYLFLAGANAYSPELSATVQQPLWTAYIAYSNAYMPAYYTYINANTTGEVGSPAWTWAYCSPDAYASGIEGQLLLNNPLWTVESARNLSINDSGGGTSTNTYGFSIITDSGQRRTKMIGY